MKPVVLVVGCPASGKTWVCKQLSDKFFYVPHDDYEEREYPAVLIRAASPTKPVLGEVPFGLSKIHGVIQSQGIAVQPVFILEEEPVLRARYQSREGRPIITGHLSRQHTYRQRAHELGAFSGTSSEVLKYLRELPL